MTFLCPVCSQPSIPQFESTVLRRHVVSYCYCSSCGYLFAPAAHWLEEAYSSAIAFADTGLVYRNIRLAQFASAFLFLTRQVKGVHLDLAGGTGLFTRLMRDNGFDYYWDDPYAENIHARGFAYEKSLGKPHSATAFEVLEHLPSPASLFERAFKVMGVETLITSTELYAGHPPDPAQWDYYAFETGQHIGFFQERTLATLARQFDLQFERQGNIQVFSKRPINRYALKLALVRPSVVPMAVIRKVIGSKIMPDYYRLLKAN